MEPTTHEHPRRRRRFGALLLMAALTASLGAGAISLALFTDTASSSGSFSTGTINIATNKTVLFSVGDLMPGDARKSDIVVSNAGTAELRYAISTGVTSGNTLANALTVRVYANNDCSGTALDSASFGFPLLGSNVAGPDTGDRTLAGGGSEPLCFEVSLPDTADTSLQGQSTEVTFTFDAEQTKNNP